MRLCRRDISLVDLDRGAGESGIGVAALTFQPLLRAERAGNYVGILVRFEVVFDVRLIFGVGDTDRISRGFGHLEGVRHGEGNVLAVVTNDIVIERRAPLFTDAFHALSHY